MSLDNPDDNKQNRIIEPDLGRLIQAAMTQGENLDNVIKELEDCQQKIFDLINEYEQLQKAAPIEKYYDAIDERGRQWMNASQEQIWKMDRAIDNLWNQALKETITNSSRLQRMAEIEEELDQLEIKEKDLMKKLGIRFLEDES